MGDQEAVIMEVEVATNHSMQHLLTKFQQISFSEIEKPKSNNMKILVDLQTFPTMQLPPSFLMRRSLRSTEQLTTIKECGARKWIRPRARLSDLPKT